MSVRVKFVASRAGISELGRSPAMVAEMKRRAEVVAVRARAIAPVRTGRYKASIKATAGVRAGRAQGRVTASAPWSSFLEFGTSRMRRQRILGRALLSAGATSLSVYRPDPYSAYKAGRR